MHVHHSPRGDRPGELRNHVVGIHVEDSDTKQLHRILIGLLPGTLDRFARKNKSYGENSFELGSAGQFPEIWRKVKRLRALIWDERGDTTEFETLDEVIDDLIGHLLMLKDCVGRAGDAAIANPDVYAVRSADVIGHLIREAKDPTGSWAPGTGTWVTDVGAPVVADERGVLRYPASFKGRHSYLVGDVQPDGHVVVEAHGKRLRVAKAEEVRCGWHTGDRMTDLKRCVGLDAHSEEFHINKDLEAWPV